MQEKQAKNLYRKNRKKIHIGKIGRKFTQEKQDENLYKKNRQKIYIGKIGKKFIQEKQEGSQWWQKIFDFRPNVWGGGVGGGGC